MKVYPCETVLVTCLKLEHKIRQRNREHEGDKQSPKPSRLTFAVQGYTRDWQKACSNEAHYLHTSSVAANARAEQPNQNGRGDNG